MFQDSIYAADEGSEETPEAELFSVDDTMIKLRSDSAE